MKRLILFVAFAVNASFLFAEPSGGPIIGRSMGKELRIRASPNVSAAVVGSLGTDEVALVFARSADMASIDGLRAYWLRVVGVKGVAGWVYGGYLDADTSKLASCQVDSPGISVTIKDLSAAFGEGKATHVFVKYPEAWIQITLEVLFLQTAKGGVKVAYANLTESRSDGGMDYVDTRLIDLVGDDHKELCVEYRSEGGSGSSTLYRVYIFDDVIGGYAESGTIHLTDAEVDGGGYSSFTSVIKGPYAFTTDGKKGARIVV